MRQMFRSLLYIMNDELGCTWRGAHAVLFLAARCDRGTRRTKGILLMSVSHTLSFSDPMGPEPRGTGQVGRGSDWLSLDRRHNDSAQTGGLDPPPGPARRGLFPHQGRPVDQLGERHEGTLVLSKYKFHSINVHFANGVWIHLWEPAGV